MRIKELRKKAGLTQNELAEKTGVSLMSIRRYETGERLANFELLMKICKALGVSLAELVGEENMGQYVSDIKKELGDYDWSVEMEEELYKLNSDGRKKAVELVELLTKIPEYSRQTVYDDIYESERED